MRTVVGAMRTLAEHLSRGVVLRRRLPAEYGRTALYVSPGNGGLRYWRRNLRRIDPALFAFVDDFVPPGATVWDVGANVGLFAFAAFGRVGDHGYVVMLEPDLDNARLILRSRRLLPPDRAERLVLVPAAAADHAAPIARFAIAARSRASNALDGFGNSQMGGIQEFRHVPVVSLDGLLAVFPAPRVVKVDVERAELMVLGGAVKLLDTVRPVMHIEVAGDNARRVADVLRGARYKTFCAETRREQRTECEVPAANCIAIPQELVAQYSAYLA